MTKILVINLGKHYGGAEKLIETLLENNGEMIVALDVNGELIKKINSDTEIIECSTKGLEIIKTIIKLKKIIKNNDIKIIHTHGVPSNLVGLILKNLTGVKQIATIHSDLNFDFSGIKKNMYLTLEKFVLPRIDKVICVSNELKSKIQDRCSNIECIVINNGVKKGSNNRMNTVDEKINFLLVGRLTKVKNHELMIKALAKLNKDKFDFKCVIVGEGEEKENLGNLILQHDLDEKVILEGFRDDVRLYMNKSDALVMTSLMEGIPLVILEAFAEKLLVISSKVGGIEELIDNEVNGILYNSNNVDELYDILKDVLLNKVDRNKIIENAYDSFICQWSDENMISKYKVIYQEQLR